MQNENISCMLQDRQGFMWFGTRKGLHRYDGYEFTVYGYDVRDTTSISSDDILSLCEDRSGALWAGTMIDGLNRFDRAGGKFTRFRHNPDNPRSLSANQVLTIYEDRSGTLWIGTAGGLNRLDSGGKNFTRFMHDPQDSSTLSGWTVRALLADHAGVFWICTTIGLDRYDRERESFIRYPHDPENPRSPYPVGTLCLYEDHSGTLWIGTVNGLYRYDHTADTFTGYSHDPGDPRSLSDNVVWAIREDRAGTLWIGTEAGLNIMDRAGGQFTRLTHDPGNPYSLINNFVTSIMEDRAGALWVGSGSLWGRGRGSNFGINRYDPAQQRFRHFIPAPADRTSQQDFSVHTVFEDRAGLLWIGTFRDGLYRLDRTTGRYHRFVNDPANPRSLSQDFVTYIFEDRSGTLWIGTGDAGLNRFERERKTFTQYAHDPDDPTSLSHNRVESIFEDSAGVFWIATFGGGINRFDRETGRFTPFRHDEQDPHSLSTDLTSKVYEDRNGTLWVSTWNGGLNRFDREQGTFTRFLHDPKDPNSLSNNIIWSFYEDRAGNFWLATGGGLNRLDRASGTFSCVTKTDGLPDNNIYDILEDRQGRLWLSTDNGVSRFDPRDHSIRNFGLKDGLHNTTLNFHAPGQSRDGVLFFCGNNGVDYFHPDSIRDNPEIPPVFITRLTHYTHNGDEETAIVDEEISEKEQVAFAYAERNFTVDFAALNFRSPEKNHYAYQLEGVQDNWVPLGTRRSLTFTSLAPGSYTLRIKGSNNDGVWNETGTALRITIRPPWWRSYWAYGIYLLLFAATLYGWRRYDLRRIHLQNEALRLQEIDRLKSRLFAGISHEFRTPLTLIQGPVKLLLSGEFTGNLKEQYQIILRNCNRLLRLVNQLLDLAKLESGSMKLQARPHDIVSLTRQLTMAFESLAAMRGIELSFSAPAEAVEVYLERRHYETIITNLLSNALKFTPEGGKVLVQVATGQATNQPLTTDNCLLITIKDTGPGIPAADLPHIFDRFYQAGNAQAEDARGSGIGLALVKELVELHHGSISVTSEMGKGTEFVLKLPLGKGHLKPEEIDEERGAKSVERDAESKVWEDIEPSEPAISSLPPITNRQKPASSIQHPASVVLLVEDNPDMRAYIRDLLLPDYQVLEAVDGQEGLKRAKDAGPDLIISDVMMPGMDGFEFCEKIKTSEQTSHIPVILLTARASGESKLEGLETGADDYLTKPFDAAELRVRVRNLIEQRRRLRERFHRELIIKPSEVTATPMDEAFLSKVMAAVEAHIDDPAFETDDLAREAGVSRRHLNRKLRALTGQSVREFIRSIRLKRAAQLLQKHAGTITEIAYAVGFQSIAHFAKAFREQFGVAPSAYKGDEDEV